jgi:flagellar protein FlbD
VCPEAIEGIKGQGIATMIIVTKLNNSRFAVNPDLVERIHSNPDTTLTLVDGTTYIVTESMEEVIELMARYRAKVISIARSVEPEPRRILPGQLVQFPDPVVGTASIGAAPKDSESH